MTGPREPGQGCWIALFYSLPLLGLKDPRESDHGCCAPFSIAVLSRAELTLGSPAEEVVPLISSLTTAGLDSPWTVRVWKLGYEGPAVPGNLHPLFQGQPTSVLQARESVPSLQWLVSPGQDIPGENFWGSCNPFSMVGLPRTVQYLGSLIRKSALPSSMSGRTRTINAGVSALPFHRWCPKNRTGHWVTG